MTYLSFNLPQSFVEQYSEKSPEWGFVDGAGNSFSEIIFMRTYSRVKPDGAKEKWYEVCERVINGMYSIQKDWAKENRLPWNDRKAQASAQEAYERLFSFKWTPPGRGLWVMGTPLVNEQKNSAPLQNCAFRSTADMTRYDPGSPYAWIMEASMLGVGVGFDDKGADKGFMVNIPGIEKQWTYQIPDTREGWAESLRLLINSYLIDGRDKVNFDYSLIRPEGSPINTFGGTASGPAPLKALHVAVRSILDARTGSELARMDIADIVNLIGVCVVAGNVRRSAELYMGQIDDKEFLSAKDYYWDDKGNVQGSAARRAEWGWLSNNSVEARVGSDYSGIIDGIQQNGEPGIIWMDVTRKYGRLIDGVNNKDRRAAGYNPCAEQPLESAEMCTLVETYLTRHESVEDYIRTLKFAYLYAKTVTLLPTHWPETNAIMQRNRRIGTGASAAADFADEKGLPALREWFDAGYAAIQKYDETYSEWLCVRQSIKTTTIKPSGTVSLLAGVSPGVHWSPGGEYFLRTVRFRVNEPLVADFIEAGYRVEPAETDPEGTVVVYFPVRSRARRSDTDVSLFEKANLAATAQRYWSDNSVSVTLSFNPETEGDQIHNIIHMFEGQLKTVSFLKIDNTQYNQMPYTRCSEDEYLSESARIKPVDLSPRYLGENEDAVGEKFCTTDTCTI
jgi:ribonucleoside-triphosphate reductase